MLFAALLKPKPESTQRERMARRAQWQYPEGVRPVAEYWLQTSELSVISIFETDMAEPILAVLGEWGDLFDITVVPALRGEEGLAIARQMLNSDRSLGAGGADDLLEGL